MATRTPDETHVMLAARDLAEKTLEAVGTHYSPAAWRNEEGGYVGHADWRHRKYGGGTRSYCGHKHRQEDTALACIEAILAAARQGQSESED
jgi:hypothetical protein